MFRIMNKITLIAIFLFMVLIIFIGSDCERNYGDIIEHIAPVNWKNYSWSDAYRMYPNYPIVLPTDTWLMQHNLMPFWNSTRSTRNTSWDIRGDVKPSLQSVGPWNISPLIY